MVHRLILDTLLVLSVILMPFWFTVVFALILLFYFKDFWEIIPILFLVDLLYAVPEHRFINVVIILLVDASIVYLISGSLKQKLKFYKTQ